MAPVDPMAHDQLKAAQDAARAAWAAVDLYRWALWPTVIGLLFNALIALVAIRGPERERHTRDLVDRKQRTRLYIRASLAGLRGLSAARSLKKYIARQGDSSEPDVQTLAHHRRRLDVRRRVIEHFLGMELRDLNLVGWLFETSVLLQALHDGIDLGKTGMAEGAVHEASEVLTHRAERLDALRTEFQRFGADKRAKDASLERDLERVWDVAWLVQVWKRPETERD